MIFKKIFYKIIFVFGICGFLFLPHDGAQALYRVSDQISTSQPGMGASHTIQFRNVKAIPADGKIVIAFDDNFILPDDLGYADFDFAVSTNLNGPFLERELAATSSAIFDGITLAPAEKIAVINLNTNAGIGIGSYLRLIIGVGASHGADGIRNILNPVLSGSYSVELSAYDASQRYLEAAVMQIAIVEPVGMGTYSKKRYLGASPVGWMNFGTTETIMSLLTNYPARCRYDTASGTPFMGMANDFAYSSSSLYYYNHTAIIDGLQNGGNYEFYIRCIDEAGVRDITNDCYYSGASTTPYFTASGTPITYLECVDYYIPFSISGQEGEGGGTDYGSGGDIPDESGGATNTGGGSGSGSGGGGGGGIGAGAGMYLPYPPPPGAPGVVFTGWAFPNSEVVILQDGVEQGKVLAKSDASFAAYVEELNRGVYTFGIWSQDSAQRRTNTFSTTFWLEANTQTTVSDIILAPTIALAAASVTAGQMLELSGQSAPGATIEAWLYPEKSGEVFASEIIKKSGLASGDGTWTLFLDTKDLTDGAYFAKARATVSNKGTSDFSKLLKANIGAAPVIKEGVCAGADLNFDGKVNLTDFSILLYHWGTGNECADQNHDGTVNLTDFSIMMFYWTG